MPNDVGCWGEQGTLQTFKGEEDEECEIIFLLCRLVDMTEKAEIIVRF